MRPRIRLDIVDLDLFVNIANRESLTAGGERSSMSVGAASARIRNLEESLGARLLVRSRRGMTLTLAGRIFDQYAREVLGQTTRAVEEIGRFRENSGHVRVGANVVAASRFLASTLGAFLAENPGVSLALHEGLSSDIVRSVRDGAMARWTSASSPAPSP